MMTCAQVRPILSFFLEKETDPLETLETRRHLDSCAACRSRADRLGAVMGACAALPERAPGTDVASEVMSRLRALRSASPDLARSARWSGLLLILAAMLSALARPDARLFRTLSRPIDLLVAFLGGGDPGDGLAGRIVPILLRGVGGNGLRPELTAGAGLDLLISVQVLATALAIGLLIAIPVAVMTLWFLRSSADRRASNGV